MLTEHCTESLRSPMLAYRWWTQRASNPSCSGSGSGSGCCWGCCCCVCCAPFHALLAGESGAVAAGVSSSAGGVLQLYVGVVTAAAPSAGPSSNPCMPAMLGPMIVYVLPLPVCPNANTAGRAGTVHTQCWQTVHCRASSVCWSKVC
jgi:hypothetical protein